MGKSNIPYIEYVWNCVTGCSGKNCQANCYARDMVKRFPKIHSEFEPLPFDFVRFWPSRLSEPLHWKKPRVVGVGFFGDFFDSQVSLLWQHQVYEVIKKCPQHQFIILTKQAANMRDRLEGGEPLPNIWHGTTVTTQPEADERIPELLKVPGKKWISYEPALEYVNFAPYLRTGKIAGIVMGCESGAKRRNMEYSWALFTKHDCAASDTMLYMKQIPLYGKVSHNPEEWPEELRLRDLPWRKA